MPKLIKLTQNQYTIVDDEDFEKLNQFKWYAHKIRKNYYAERKITLNGKKFTIRMHRQLIPCCEGKQPDHKNRNSLDNRKSNLRIATHSQNSQNRSMHKNNKSGVKGVSWDKNGNKWRALITVDKRKIQLGQFTNLQEAINIRRNAALQYFGEFSEFSN